MYSQHEEEALVAKYFDGNKGRFLDVGAFNGKIFSNTLALYERGWTGTCVDASPQCFVGMQKIYKDKKGVQLVSAAISTGAGCLKFYDNGGAVATLSKGHMKQWNKPQNFTEIYVAAITPKELLDAVPGPYHFFSLDIEDATLPTLPLFPLRVMGVRLVCVEAYTDVEREVVRTVLEPQGFEFWMSTVLNVLYRNKA